ncbi:hypothetical protein N0V91_001595 [Didymella pomorum]|uniref:Uncharacterized protein n=1 Tax=Didymella pomorum TaxID=749634 RepID=A0A9W8ZMZ5_9PLEO|nr:hypothetical protein N0V91_001595 [Didymella pomorum]
MTSKLSRKRSRLTLESDDDEDERLRQPLPALQRSKTQCELDELDIIDPKDAWTVDIGAILARPTLAVPPGSGLMPHNNWQRYKKGGSITVLCVQGNMQLHYNLLCSALEYLYSLSPSLQAIILCHDPPSHKLSTTAPYSLPMISAVDPPNNHFVRLGLLHPLGGGKFPLDALAVVDRKGRRRLVLPFGWGAGKHADTPAGKSIQNKMITLLKHCIRALEEEA